MALNFPTNPSDGDLFDRYVFDGTKGVWNIVPDDVFPYYVGPTKPANPKDGTAWFNSENGTTYMYYEDVDGGQWVATSGMVVSPSLSEISNFNDVTFTLLSEGDVITYDSDTSQWVNSNPNNQIVKLNPQTVSENLTIPSGYNGITAGPITITDGVIVTIANGSAWSIV